MVLGNKKINYGPRRFDRKPVRHDYSNLLKELKNESEQGNLSLLEKTILKQEEDAKNITATEICKEIVETEKIKRRRASLMSDMTNLYAYSSDDNTCHDRDCELVAEIPDDKFRMSSTVESVKFCKYCHLRLALRAGIIDDYKNIDSYVQFFSWTETAAIHYLTIQHGGRFRFVDETKKSIKIKVREDEWILEKVGSTFHLYHNNYIKLEDGGRHFTDGFHKQQCKLSSNAYYAISTMCTYSYDKHVEEKEQQEKEKRLYGYDCPLWIKQLIKELKVKRNHK